MSIFDTSKIRKSLRGRAPSKDGEKVLAYINAYMEKKEANLAVGKLVMNLDRRAIASLLIQAKMDDNYNSIMEQLYAVFGDEGINALASGKVERAQVFALRRFADYEVAKRNRKTYVKKSFKK